MVFEVSLDFYKKLFDKLLEGVLLVDWKGKVLFANKAAVKIVGAKELLNHNIRNFIAKESLTKAFKDLAKVKLGWGGELSDYKLKNGIWVRGLGHKIEINGKKVTLVTIRDISSLKETKHELKERVKELKTLYNFSRIVEKEDSLEKIFKGLVRIILPGFQHPELACARIKISGDEYKTGNFKKTKYCLSENLVVKGEDEGVIQVCYLKKRNFLDEEKELVHVIAERLGRIIERKRVEEMLFKSEAKYREIFKSSPEAIVMVDEKGRMVDVNNRLADWLGYDPEKYLGKNFMKMPFITAKSKAVIIKNLGLRLLGKEVPPYDVDFKTKDGETRTGRIRGARVTDEGGEVIGDLVMITDVTELRESQEELEESRNEYRALVESSNDIIYSMTPEGIIDYISPQVRVYGYKPEYFIGKEFFKLVLPEDRDKVMKDAEKTLKTGEEFPTEFRIKDSEGSVIWLEEKGRVVYDNGEPVKIIGVIRDITSQKEYEKKLKDAKNRYQELFQNSSDLIQSFNLDRKLIEVNDSWLESMGYERDEVIGRDLLKFIHESSKDKCLELFKKVIKGETLDSIQAVFKKKDGGKLFVKGIAHPVKKEGEITGTWGQFRDVTKERLLERQRQEKAITKLKDHFIMRVSHELRHPLMPITGFAKELLEQELSRPEQEEYLKKIINNAEQLEEQVNKILSITSLRAGRELLSFEKISIKKVINSVLKDYADKIKAKGLKLKKDFKASPRIKADPEKLKDLLDNLLDNAVKYTDSGSIKVSLGKSDDYAIISVKDSGSGIPDEQLKSLDVHKFSKESYEELYEGVGLGLIISKLIAEAHKGSLEIKSKEGRGTTVIVKLPVK